jgi:hypothetical protein
MVIALMELAPTKFFTAPAVLVEVVDVVHVVPIMVVPPVVRALVTGGAVELWL